MSTKTATFVRVVPGFEGRAELYRVDPPAIWLDYDGDGYEIANKTNYIIVAGVDRPLSGPEMSIFPADQDGNVLDPGKLRGSFQGDIDFEIALHGAGYEAIRGPNE